MMKIKEFKWIPINKLKISNEVIRKTMIDREKDSLKRSIRANGIKTALEVVYNKQTKYYEVFKGQRRLLACKELKKEGFPIKELPCVVKEPESPTDITEELLIDELESNAVKEPNDIGKIIEKLVKKYGSITKVAQQLGIAEDWLNYYIQHLSLDGQKKYNFKREAIKPTAEELKRLRTGLVDVELE